MNDRFNFTNFFQLVPEIDTVWVAYSGGCDSHVLLHALKYFLSEKIPEISLKAIHINHQLHPKAKEWAEHCQAIGVKLDVPCHIKNIKIELPRGTSLEAQARIIRYQAFQSIMDSKSLLVTAHHQDDQAETVLLQLLRGAGVSGLAAMPTFTTWKKGYHGRPLLAISRSIIRDYAQKKGLNWVEDDSNQSLCFDRNYLRQKVLPLLVERWPQANRTIARSAIHCASAHSLLTELGEQDYRETLGTSPSTLSIRALLQLPLTRQQNLLRYAMRELGFSVPSTAKINQIIHEMLSARPDTQPIVTCHNMIMRRYRDNLFFLPSELKIDIPPLDQMWDLRVPFILPNGLGYLSAQPNEKGNLTLPEETQTLTISTRRPGQSSKLPGRTYHKTLKKLFQEWGIPPWLRWQIPLLSYQDQLLGVPGYYLLNPIFSDNRPLSRWQLDWSSSPFTNATSYDNEPDFSSLE